MRSWTSRAPFHIMRPGCAQCLCWRCAGGREITSRLATRLIRSGIGGRTSVCSTAFLRPCCLSELTCEQISIMAHNEIKVQTLQAIIKFLARSYCQKFVMIRRQWGGDFCLTLCIVRVGNRLSLASALWCKAPVTQCKTPLGPIFVLCCSCKLSFRSAVFSMLCPSDDITSHRNSRV